MYSTISRIVMISNYTNVELAEQKVWNCNRALLLLHLEKELEDEVKMLTSEKNPQVCDATGAQ